MRERHHIGIKIVSGSGSCGDAELVSSGFPNAQTYEILYLILFSFKVGRSFEIPITAQAFSGHFL